MPLLVVGKLSVTSAAIREEYVQRLISLSEYAQKSEPGVSKYVVFIPRDEEDDKTCWVIEEYADQATFDTHMTCPLVKEMIKWMGSGNILAAEPVIRLFDYVNGLSFAKTDVSNASDPYVVFGTIEYHPGKREAAIPYWTNVFHESEKEAGTFVYGLLAIEGKNETLHTLEAYESKDYLWDVHVKQNSSVQASIRDTKDWRVSLGHDFLKRVGGFWYR